MKTHTILTAIAVALTTTTVTTDDSPASELQKDGEWTVVACDRLGMAVLKDESVLFELKTTFHGWAWKRPRLTNLPEARERAVRVFHQNLAFYANVSDRQPLPGTIDLTYELKQTGPKAFLMRFTCRPDEPMQFAMPGNVDDRWATVGPFLPPNAYFDGGTCRVEYADGRTEDLTLPPPRGHSEGVKAVTLKTADGESTRFTFEPPILFHRDMSEARFWMSSGREVGADQLYTQTIAMELPRAARFEPDNRWVDTSDWFPLKVDNDFVSPSLISMADWQDRPAGKHGFMQMKGNRYEFEDGTLAKLWGVNLINWQVDEQLFDRWAEALAKYGVNLGRMVAFGRPNYPNKWAHYVKIQDVEDGLKFDPGAMKLFDYGFAKLKEHGVYVAFSPFYGWYPTPADKQRLINHDELMGVLRKAFPCQGSFYGVTCFAPDVQDLQIQFHVNLLNHVNPYTGLRYADDPALVFVELQNEENTFLQLWRIEEQLDKCPTYKKRYYQGFAEWLKRNYESHEALAEAWGNELKPEESLDKANIVPLPGYFVGNATSPRVADQMAYVYQTQSDYYRRFAEAVRATGYKGGLSASCWQACNWIGHLHNVQADREIGHIDRHNYATADLKNPGVGLLSAGLQAVLDRPFSYSEWHGNYRVGTNLDVPMVAVYGMGLQGWDLSMEFAWTNAGALPYDHLGINDVINDFGVLGQYPALARMVRRMDVAEGEVVARRRISLPALREKADVGFAEPFSLLGGANNKRFETAVPQAALAAGRVVLEYVDGEVQNPIIDTSARYIDQQGKAVRSTTDQLLWDARGEGFFTVDTPGTKAVIGYGGGKTYELGQLTITPETPFANIYVTALGKDETIATAKRLLITTMARMVDKGTRFDEFSERPIVRVPPKVGPLVIEPVNATFTLKGVNGATVFALDHDGRKPADAVEIPVEQTDNGLRFMLDGRDSRAVYYSVEIQGE